MASLPGASRWSRRAATAQFVRPRTRKLHVQGALRFVDLAPTTSRDCSRHPTHRTGRSATPTRRSMKPCPPSARRRAPTCRGWSCIRRPTWGSNSPRVAIRARSQGTGESPVAEHLLSDTRTTIRHASRKNSSSTQLTHPMTRGTARDAPPSGSAGKGVCQRPNDAIHCKLLSTTTKLRKEHRMNVRMLP